MHRTRVKLDVYVDLDPMPGTFHSVESVQHSVRSILEDRISHYKPMVSVSRNDEDVVAEMITVKAELKRCLDELQPASVPLLRLMALVDILESSR